MRSIRRLKTCLASLALISFTTVALASPGSYTFVKKGEVSPFDGYCFDVPASALIIAEKEDREKWCKIEQERVLALQLAQFELEVGKLLAEFEYKNSVDQKTIESLREENLKLESTALSAPNNYWYLFVGSGILVGVATTILTIQVIK